MKALIDTVQVITNNFLAEKLTIDKARLCISNIYDLLKSLDDENINDALTALYNSNRRAEAAHCLLGINASLRMINLKNIQLEEIRG